MASGTANPEPTGIGRGVREDQSQQIANPQITQTIGSPQVLAQVDARLAVASQAGYRCFTTVTEFQRYVQTEILVEAAPA
jgi:hypothetical protein